MLNVFIDANIWLSLYSFSSDDLDQFRKLGGLIGKEVEIYFPEQVRKEVYRNRENKIKEALAKLENLQMPIPNLCKGYSQYGELRDKFRELQAMHSDFVRQIKRDIAQEKLHADLVIKEIFEKITPIECSHEIIALAKERFDTGDPPGKDRKYGDAINWVALLHGAPDEDLCFVSADQDYRSQLNDGVFNAYLLKEWHETKHADLHFYKSLAEFLSQHLKVIELKNETFKAELTEELRESINFKHTHAIIGQMRQQSSWSSEQVQELCQIAQENSQVSGIIHDNDLSSFFSNILYGYQGKESDAVAWVREQLTPEEDDIDEDMPY